MLFTSHLMSIDSMCRLLRSIFVKCSTENPPTQQFNISHVTKLTNIHINATTNNTATTTAVVTKLPPFKDCHPLATPHLGPPPPPVLEETEPVGVERVSVMMDILQPSYDPSTPTSVIIRAPQLANLTLCSHQI